MRYCSDDFTNLISPSAHHLMTSQFMTGRHVIDILWWLDSTWLSGLVVNFKMFVNTGDVRHDGLPVGALHASHVAGVLKAGIKECHQSGPDHIPLPNTGVCHLDLNTNTYVHSTRRFYQKRRDVDALSSLERQREVPQLKTKTAMKSAL